jgi:formyltetrahydrofolate deformylase
MSMGTIKLLISCPDAKGIVAAVAGFVAHHQGNILDAEQHTDPAHGEFFMRIEIDPSGFGLDRASFAAPWQPTADGFGMRWRIDWGDTRKRMAVLVSREDHCLDDLLWRWRTRELLLDIPFVISNHLDVRGVVEGCGLPYHHVPNTPAAKDQCERRVLGLLREAAVDFVVLARYMQVLSPAFVAEYPERIINIHHSFLPAFAGGRPYHQAYERGVKIIGATSHYVTDELDQGPIIAQGTFPVDHRDSVDDLIRKGRDLERLVLATAVRQHVEDKILVSKNKTVVFH